MKRIKIRHMSKKTLGILIAWNLTFPSHIFAVQIEIKNRMNIHTSNENLSSLQRVLTLPPGTIVQIPDENIDPKKSKEQNLVDWIRNNSQLKSFTNSLGENKKDYFSEIEIVSIPDPSLRAYQGKKFQMALQYLIKNNENYSFYTRTEATAYKPSSDIPQNTTETPSIEASCIDCLKTPEPRTLQTPNLSKLEHLKELTSSFFNTLESKSDLYIKTKDPLRVIQNFSNTCKGMDFSDFKQYLKSESEAENIPAELLLGIMTQESSGRCFPEDSQGNYGLFQINKRTSSTKPLCTTEQKRKISVATLSELKINSNLQCLENPVVNASEAIRIFKEKFKSTNKSNLPNLKKWSQYSYQERDALRRAVAAYNGGQTHVNRASQDLIHFKNEYAPDLDIDSFELQRIFFFRKILKQEGHVASTESARSTQNTIDNLAYTQSITGKEPITDSHFIQQWEFIMNSSQVATR